MSELDQKTVEKMQKAFQDGWDDFQKTFGWHGHNPFEKDSVLWQEWRKGYISSRVRFKHREEIAIRKGQKYKREWLID